LLTCTIDLLKIEEGFCAGNVVYHQLINKSKKEILELSREIKVKRKEKAKRKLEQEDNIQKKKQELGIDSEAEEEQEEVDESGLTRKQRGARKKRLGELSKLKKVKFAEDQQDVY
jgi:ribosome biogenesis protein SSF1/2